ncbi:hypothetical protein, partial [Paenibacillus riograndensis]|uniref:hypothetical protein n=1 Tax=Paenibacillus riograndensis TaxID=483937 RepID=UPI001C0A6E3B
NPFRGSRKSSAVGEPFDALLGLASNKGFQPQSKPPVIRVVLIIQRLPHPLGRDSGFGAFHGG